MWRNLSSLVTNLYLVAIFTTMTSPLATPTTEHVKPDRDSDMANTERTFIMVKPDGVQRGLIADIMKRFEQKGFKLVALKMMKVNQYLYICTPACIYMCGRCVDYDHCMVQASEGLLKKHYAELSEKKFFPGLIKFMQSGPVVAMVS